MEKDKDILRIIPYTDKTKSKFKYSVPKELGLDNCFSMILVGGTGAGKTTVMSNLIRILDPKNFKKPNRFVISSTWDDDTTLHSKVYRKNVFTEYDDDLLLRLVEMIKSENAERLRKGKKKEHFMLIVDDMLGLIPKNASLYPMFVKNRHANISIMLSVQHFHGLMPVARFNSTCYVIFSTINRKELENIDMELNKKYPNQLFKQKFLEKIKGYDFLFINVKKQLYLVNFKEPLITDEELKEYEEGNK